MATVALALYITFGVLTLGWRCWRHWRRTGSTGFQRISPDVGLLGLTGGVGNMSPLHRFVRGEPMSNAETVKLYQRARVALNLHRTDTMDQAEAAKAIKRGKRRGVLGTKPMTGEAYSIGPRAYELAACGAFQICDDTRPELRAAAWDPAAPDEAAPPVPQNV